MSSGPIQKNGAAPAGGLGEANLDGVLGYLLAQARIVTDSLFVAEVAKPLQLRPVEYTVLMLIAENPGGSPAQLARALAVTPPNITALMARLESRGLLERKVSASDRRSQTLAVTRKGAELARKATERIAAAEQTALPLTPGEKAILAELLRKVAGARAK
jgi:DNA-binding MarR family transcriptional regulator